MSVGTILLIVVAAAVSQLPGVGAGGLLHPARRQLIEAAPPTCQDETFHGEGLDLKGWRCQASTSRRGTLVYLHGIADNRASAAGVIDRFGKLGFDVVAYDGRAHGDSAGDACTYGFLEKRDLQRVLDTVGPGPIVLVGTSLGAAVALQAAALDQRVTAVVAAESFSDLRTVASERAPFFFTTGIIARAFRLAEQQGHFEIDAVSPVKAATEIKIPVLLIHGAADTETPPAHSRRIFDALAGPKRLILVPGGQHNESLRGETWAEIEAWLEGILESQSAALGTQARVGSVVLHLEPTTVVRPTLPDAARVQGIVGPVLVEVRISETGEVSVLSVVRGHPLLNDLAKTAVGQWKYPPTVFEGHAIPVIATVVVPFVQGQNQPPRTL